MKALFEAEVLEAEARAKAVGWSEGELLRMAGRQLGVAIGRFFPRPRFGIAYLGKGHNAGDAVMALSVLRDDFGWDVAARCAYPESEWAPLLSEVWRECGPIQVLEAQTSRHGGPLSIVMIDGLAGMGLHGPLREPLAGMAAEINHSRSRLGAAVASVDLPSGCAADSGAADDISVLADATFQIANPKAGLLKEESAAATGSLVVVPVAPLQSGGAGDLSLIAAPSEPCMLPCRAHDFHKGRSGRVGILAGSAEYPGAAVLAATAALHSGAGLVFLDVPSAAYEAVVSRCPPEIIVCGVDSPCATFERTVDSLVVGCGLGRWAEENHDELLDGLKTVDVPTVVDADALNRFARNPNWEMLGPRHILTPHPAEFARLGSELSEMGREEAVKGCIDRFGGVLVLKGARTIVASATEGLWINGTGNAGMATGGSGDWLSGVIGALAAGALSPHESACLGVWLCGRCAELARWRGMESPESYHPTENTQWMGLAFQDWRSGNR